MFILGLDIGYSNLKMACGEVGSNPKTKILPSGAAPKTLLPHQLQGGQDSECITVEINGEPWVAGVNQDRLQGWERELHQDYSASSSYMALFYAALLLCERESIDVLVTGLPVNQFNDVGYRETLQKRLIGTHQVTPKRSITVGKVVVVQQPAGAYMDVVFDPLHEEMISTFQRGRTIVIDPGFFSVDWVALDGGEVRHQSSGTSLKAMSMVLEEADLLIRGDHGGSPGVAKLEKAIRECNTDVLLYGQSVELQEYLERSAEKVAVNALIPLRRSMREEGLQADIVLITGGGSEVYQSAAKDIFPQSRIIVPSDPVMANARGFWRCVTE